MTRSTTTTIVSAFIALALSPACTVIEPEVGERLTACVDADSNPNVKVVFKDQIRPLINGMVPGPKPCANCHYHSSGTREGLDETGFDLETLKALKLGGRRTFDDIVVPGQPCKSAIVQKLKGTYEGARMPKGGPYWTAEQIQLMIDWIAEGAVGANEE
ncbi:MAG: hypothetical protein JWP87_1149 [Labilithrix sp.]|jgi:hypothetical protein|nr:hypothetical protein [Labilithrix sp.]